MKTMVKHILTLLLLPAMALAGGTKGKYTKEKKISKTYNVSATAALDVSNKYGTIYVTTWDESQTVIDVVIKVSADKEDQLDKRLNSIDVAFTSTNAKVTADTKIGNFSGRNVSMEINYTIKIPKKNTVNLTNQYGNIILGKIYGTTLLKLQYGNLTIDELNGTKNEISLQYSDAANINYLALSKINAQYSDVKVVKATEELIVNAEYSDCKIGSAGRLSINGTYGDLKVDAVAELKANVNYMDTKIGTITKLCTIHTKYGDVSIGRITKDVRETSISGSYSSISIKYDAGHAFDFEAKASYGDVSGLQGITIQEKKEAGSGSYYKGYYRSGGSARITVQSNYGDVTMAKI